MTQDRLKGYHFISDYLPSDQRRRLMLPYDANIPDWVRLYSKYNQQAERTNTARKQTIGGHLKGGYHTILLDDDGNIEGWGMFAYSEEDQPQWHQVM